LGKDFNQESKDVKSKKVGIIGMSNIPLGLYYPAIGAADAMSAAMPIIEEEISRVGASHESLGKVVIGTVYGDIHNIGKNMVATLMTAEGFTVHDAGINVTAEQFIDTIKEHGADILAMSALLTTTA